MSSQNSDLLSAEHLAAKKAWRKSRAALPMAEKVKILEKLRARNREFRAVRLRMARCLLNRIEKKARQTLKDLERVKRTFSRNQKLHQKVGNIRRDYLRRSEYKPERISPYLHPVIFAFDHSFMGLSFRRWHHASEDAPGFMWSIRPGRGAVADAADVSWRRS